MSAPGHQPACCVPSERAALAERLYCAYQQGGPPERAGLAWNGEPCPTWADLEAQAAAGKVGAQAVLAKWKAVATHIMGIWLDEREPTT